MAKTYTTAELDAIEKRTYTTAELDAMTDEEPALDEGLLSLARQALAATKKKPTPAPWREEARHAIGRGGIKTMAAGPGTLASLMEAGARMPGAWAPRTPEIMGMQEKTARRLRKQAENIYRAADVPSLQPTRGGVGGFLVNVAGETLPVMAASVAASALVGPTGPVLVGGTTSGEMVYQEAIKGGATPKQAEVERWVAGPVMGLIERLQADEILKINKKAVPALVEAARKRAYSLMAKEGAKITGDQLLGAAAEGLEEGLQEITQIGAATIHGDKPLTKENLKRVLTATVGGAVVGGPMKASVGAARGMGQLATEVRRAEIQNVAEAVSGVEQPPLTRKELQTLQKITGQGFERGKQMDPKAARELIAKEVQQEPVTPPIQERPQLPTSADIPTQPSVAAPAPEGQPFSARNAAVAGVREKMGLPEIPRRTPETTAQWEQEAIEQGIPDRALQIAQEIITTPRALTPQETKGFEIAARRTETAYDQQAQQLAKLDETAPEYKSVAATMKARQQEYDILSQAIDFAGTPEARSFRARQALKVAMRDDTSALSVTSRAEANKGAKLTTDERVELETKARELKEVSQKVETARKRVSRSSVQRVVRMGRRRYKGMTDAEKDAEIRGILNRPMDDAAIKQITENLASRPDVRDFDAVVARMKGLLPDVTVESVSDSIVTATQRKLRTTDELLLKLSEIFRQGRKNKKLRTDIKDLQYWLNAREVPEQQRRIPKTDTETNQKLIEIRDQLRQQLVASDAAQRAKLERQIAYLEARLANKDYGPRTRAEKPLRNVELEKLDYKRYRLQSEIRQRIADMEPRPKWWYILEPFRMLQALKSSYDVSAVLRQGGIVVRSHPIRSLRRIPDMFRAMVSPEKAYTINQKILNRPNNWLYHRAGLEFTETEGTQLTKFEEAFQSDLASRIPYLGAGVRASNRAFATFLNLVRADSFDAMTAAFTNRGGTTLPEAQAIANYVNVMTGRGSLRGLEKWSPALNGLLWSPRFTLSRIQYRLGMPILQGKTWRLRGLIAKEYARYLLGVAVIHQLYESVFGGEVQRDSRSTDYGKVVIGNTRLDPLSGLSQISVLLSREIRGKKMEQSGKVVPIRGPEVPYRGETMLSTAWRFGRSKLGFLPGTVVDVMTGADIAGQPVTLKGELLSAPIPMAWEDIYELMVDQGASKATALQTLNLFGEGLQVYEPRSSTKGPTRKGPRRAG